MNCEEFYNEILSQFDKDYSDKYFTTQCSESAHERFIVINDNKKKVSLSIFFDDSYENDERIYAEFIKVDNILAWNLKTSEVKNDKDKLKKIIMMILKGKHLGKSVKKYFAENMQPLFAGSNFEKMQKKVYSIKL